MRDGQVVKGVRFRDHRVMGDVLDLAGRYRTEGADELVFYDITASPEQRSVDRGWVLRVASVLDIPFCVAGGIRSVEDAEGVLNAGAEKISVNSPALSDPGLIERLARRFGSQCVVIGIDSQTVDGDYVVYQFTGDPDRSRSTARRTLDWVLEVQDRGAGEVVLNCMASDGVRQGYDIEQLAAVRDVCRVPLIASGGAGTPDHFVDVFRRARVDGALAASVFHSGAIAIPGPETAPGRVERRGETVTPEQARSLAWHKGEGLLPAVVQHARTGRVLMLAYMSEAALQQTLASGRAVFFSRSRQQLWTKGETSGHYLNIVDVSTDCDSDAILLLADPLGPTCHNGTESCFAAAASTDVDRFAFLPVLEATIANRIAEKPEDSYTARLIAQGPGRIAQKIGEEGVETALAAVTRDDAGLLGECADLLYHVMVLLKSRNLELGDVVTELRSRHLARD